jgi:hypothetical protein
VGPPLAIIEFIKIRVCLDGEKERRRKENCRIQCMNLDIIKISFFPYYYFEFG